jgi:glycosyltransferase involved in cell wall biosynthesis
VNSKISIIINNYNYGNFLDKTINSILNQTYKVDEIIAVDDGSTDDSMDVLNKYKSQIKVICKENGGQASAFNRGYAEATGDWIWFVDADDYLAPQAVQIVIETIANNQHDIQKISKIHSALYIVKNDTERNDELYPTPILSSGMVIDEVVSKGGYKWPPTTGNIFHRSMMTQCMPIPEDEYRLCADFFLCSFAPFAGLIVQTAAPVGYYRVHSWNSFYGLTFTKEKLARNGEILLLVAARTTQLVQQYTVHKNYRFLYDRRSLETIVIAKRFGRLNLPSHLRGLNSFREWLNSEEIKTATLKRKSVAFCYWMLLNLAPLNLAAFFVKRGMRRLSESREN